MKVLFICDHKKTTRIFVMTTGVAQVVMMLGFVFSMDSYTSSYFKDESTKRGNDLCHAHISVYH